MITVTVTNDDDATTASNVLRRYNPLRVKSLADQWRQKGWSGFDPLSEPYTEDDLVKERAVPLEKPNLNNEDDAIRHYPNITSRP